MAFLDENGVNPQVANVEPHLLRRFLLAMKRDGLAASTRARRLYALRSLWDFLERSELVATNPCRAARSPRPRAASGLPGHAGIELTAIYLHVDMTRLREAVAAHPIHETRRPTTEPRMTPGWQP